MANPTDIGQRIKELREARGMPKSELARRAGTTRNTLYRVESGRTAPSSTMVEQIARGLNVDPGELYPKARRRSLLGPPPFSGLEEERRLRLLRWIAPTATALNSLFAPKVDTGDFALEEYEQVGEAFASLDHMEGDAMSYEYIHNEGGGSEAEIEASNRVGSYHAGGPMYELRRTLQRAYETLVRREAAGVPDLEELRRRAA